MKNIQISNDNTIWIDNILVGYNYQNPVLNASIYTVKDMRDIDNLCAVEEALDGSSIVEAKKIHPDEKKQLLQVF